jgi:hypothetical protein
MLFCIVCVFVFSTAPRAAEDWYPLQCQKQAVCAPVISFDTISKQAALLLGGDFREGTMIVTTTDGSGIVHPTQEHLDSKDARAHACMRRLPVNGGIYLFKDGMPVLGVSCIFFPPST